MISSCRGGGHGPEPGRRPHAGVLGLPAAGDAEVAGAADPEGRSSVGMRAENRFLAITTPHFPQQPSARRPFRMLE